MSMCNFCAHRGGCDDMRKWKYVLADPCGNFKADDDHKDLSCYNGKQTTSTEAKADGGKSHPSYVPVEIIKAVMDVREFAVNGKYPDPRSWKTVAVDRYHEALLRHVLAIWNDPFSVDEESGLLHLSHIATNVAFMLALHKEEEGTE